MSTGYLPGKCQPYLTSQPDYLYNLISVQCTGRTRSSSLVTIARPSVSSSLQISNRSFTYASPYLWNQLPSSFRQPHSVHCPPGSPIMVTKYPVNALPGIYCSRYLPDRKLKTGKCPGYLPLSIYLKVFVLSLVVSGVVYMLKSRGTRTQHKDRLKSSNLHWLCAPRVHTTRILLLSTLNLTTVTLSTTIFLSLK